MSQKVEFSFNSPNDSPGYLLGQVTILWQRKLKKSLDPLNLTHTQFIILAALGWLSRESNKVTQVEIANQGNLDRMMVSKVLRTLESKTFVSRKEHETDTRAKVIKLTTLGTKVLQDAILKVEETDLEFFSKIDRDLVSFNKDMVKLLAENGL
ncbi:MarR family winged helix-turn-helix transcriptional regulator [Arcticibacterium luteifluviistationis]|uniref:MarR family transcriptional regulator n=1 Tax=Arcticibacterium luteifluviistationis TaxID=1784714 RepID=A0A2Z4GAI8_9BACT|nr:MarR family transcriptional regulator [Arcticibacterium luteifluviistationis]AWV98272.1 MarR family transcriptional regulator [Arcticibacterium luteifluviistationis]